MWPQPVIAMHQVMADVPLRLSGSHVACRRYPFCFQAAKQPLHRSVVPAVAASTHALLHAVAPQPLPEQAAGVLAALVGVKHHLLRPTALLMGHIKRTGSQLRI